MVDSKTILDTRLEKILKEVFQAEKIDLNFSMDEIPEWDSFKHYELIIAVENEFKIKLEDADYRNYINTNNKKQNLKVS